MERSMETGGSIFAPRELRPGADAHVQSQLETERWPRALTGNCGADLESSILAWCSRRICWWTSPCATVSSAPVAMSG